MSDMIQNGELFLPDKRLLTIGDKSFDLSEIPFEYSLKFYELLPIFQKLGEGSLITSEDYSKLFPVIFDLLKFCDSSLDEKWLRRKITLKTFPDIMTTISAAIFFDGKKKDEEQKENTDV